MPDAVCRLSYSPQEVFPDVASIESFFGRKFVGTRRNSSMPNTDWAQNDTDYDAGYTRGFRNANAQTNGAPVTALGWNSVATGVYDTSHLQPLVDSLLADTRFSAANPIIFSFHHEQTVDTTSQAGYPTNGTGQDYINAYRHVRDYFDSRNATVRSKTGALLGGKVIFAFVTFLGMHLSPPANQAVTDFDPDSGSSPAPVGTSYYEYFGCDVYNTILSGHLRRGTNAATCLDPLVAFARSKNKDWIMPEFGCEDDLGGGTISTEKGQWLSSVCDYLVALGDRSPGVCRLLGMTVGQSSGSNYYPTSSPQSLAAFQKFASHPYFGLDVAVPYPVKTYTATFAARGPVGQISFTLNTRPSSRRVEAVARRALHDTADNAPISISG